ncbi:MAG: nucleotidyltransferase family protein [Desulfovibrio sp.]|nr:nucleotidyltransferase family protein [Desulfovibrio sp.]
MSVKICAVLLAAGRSSRMGEVKALLPLLPDGSCALENLANLYRGLGVEDILVVSGFHAEVVEGRARALGLGVTRNPDPARGMFSSVRDGLRAAAFDCTHIFIHPADIPLVRPLTLAAMLQTVADVADAVIVPSCMGREGHPPLLPGIFKDRVTAYAGKDGLRGALTALPVRTVETPDSFILEDMDSPQDYARLRELACRRLALSPEEALCLLRVCRVPEKGLRHARAVGAVARALTGALREHPALYGTDKPPDPLLAQAGGLVHDICKEQKNHEKAGGQFLLRLGLPALTALTEDHRDMAVPDEAPLTEREMVYLADKYCFGAAFVTLEERFGQKLEAFSADARACAAIRQRLERARRMQARLADQFGLDAADVARNVLNSLRTE